MVRAVGSRKLEELLLHLHANRTLPEDGFYSFGGSCRWSSPPPLALLLPAPLALREWEKHPPLGTRYSPRCNKERM